MKKLATVFLMVALFCAPVTATTFSKAKMIVGDDEVDVLLRVQDGQVSILAKKSHSVLESMTPSSGEYSYSKHRRWKAGLGAAVVGGILAAPLFFMKGKKHWLTIHEGPETIGFRLDKNNFDSIISQIERDFNLQIERLGEE